MRPRNQLGNTFSSIVLLAFIGLIVVGPEASVIGYRCGAKQAMGQVPGVPQGGVPTNGMPTGGASGSDFQSQAPVMTFLDMYSGQPWGRYVVSETVTVPKYEYRQVKDKVWVPVWVQEPKQMTMTQYDPIVSYQLRPRSVPGMNPFAPPQQIVEYAPIVQYQPRNVQVTQMASYQKYEEREVSRMVPVLVNASEQRSRFVDRPLTAGTASTGTATAASSNLIQESAMLAQANRTTARYPTRPIDYPSTPTYGSPVYGYTASNATWNSPVTFVPPAAGAAPVMNVANSPAQLPTANAGGYSTTSYAAPQVSQVPQYSQAPIVPIVNPYATPVGGQSYAGTGVPIPPPSGPPTMPPIPGLAPQGTYAQGGYGNAPYGNAPYGNVPYGTNPNPYGYGYPMAGYPTAPYPSAPYPSAPYPQAGYAPPGVGYPPNPYGYPPGYGQNTWANTMAAYTPSWLYSQGSMFPSNMFTAQGGQSSMTTGGYPYKGYPPGAYPTPSGASMGYVPAPRMASNPVGVSSNAPNFIGRSWLPYNANGYPTGSY